MFDKPDVSFPLAVGDDGFPVPTASHTLKARFSVRVSVSGDKQKYGEAYSHSKQPTPNRGAVLGWDIHPHPVESRRVARAEVPRCLSEFGEDLSGGLALASSGIGIQSRRLCLVEGDVPNQPSRGLSRCKRNGPHERGGPSFVQQGKGTPLKPVYVACEGVGYK